MGREGEAAEPAQLHRARPLLLLDRALVERLVRELQHALWDRAVFLLEEADLRRRVAGPALTNRVLDRAMLFKG